MIKADNILIGGKDVGLCKDQECRLIADSGTSLITGPEDQLMSLIDSLNVDEQCKNIEKLPDITFVIDGTNYQLLPEEYVMTVNDQDVEKSYSTMNA
jgi:glutamine cyclotransferase